MNAPVLFAFSAIFEVLESQPAEVILSDAMCDAFQFDLTPYLDEVFAKVKKPEAPGVYRAWATGLLEEPRILLAPGQQRGLTVEVTMQSVTIASPENLAMLFAISNSIMAEQAEEEAAAPNPPLH